MHIALFPPHLSIPSAQLEFALLLNSSLDIFEARARDKDRVDQDLGCLQHVDERLSIYGWETGTGARFAIIVDTWGKEGRSHDSGKESSHKGVKAGDVKPVSVSNEVSSVGALQHSWIFMQLRT